MAAQPPIHVDVPRVVFPTTVRDSSGRFLTDLQAGDFEVFDGSTRIDATVDPPLTGLAPVSLVVAVQSSGISAAVLAKVKKAAATIPLAVAGDGGEIALISYADEVRLVQDFTGDEFAFSDAVEKLRPGADNSAVSLDAVEQAMTLLENRKGDRRRAILLISESRDRGSKTSFKRVLEHAQASGIVIYCLTYSAYTTPFTAKPEELAQPGDFSLLALIVEPARLLKTNLATALTSATGGSHLTFTRLRGLENDLLDAGKELHSEYLVSFRPTNDPPDDFHKVTIRVKGRDSAKVRTRSGYWASSQGREAP